METKRLEHEQRKPSKDELRGMAWWNSLTEDHRRAMLTSPMVKADPTPARCWAVFGSE